MKDKIEDYKKFTELGFILGVLYLGIILSLFNAIVNVFLESYVTAIMILLTSVFMIFCIRIIEKMLISKFKSL